MQHWKKQFITLWIGQAVSVFTSSVVQMSLVWYIAGISESAAMLTIATFIGFVPRAIISAVGGVYIDRYHKKTIMLLADGFIALVSLLLVIAGEHMAIPMWMILLILFFRSIGAAFHEPSLQASTPLIVPKQQLTQYAGYAQGFQSMSDLLSPAVAAAVYAIFPIHRIMIIDIFGAAFAAVMLAFVVIPRVKRTSEAQSPHFWAEFKAGFVALKSTQGMTMLMVICALYSVIYSPIGTLFPLVSMSHFGAGVNGSAIVETVFAVGTLVGSFLLGWLGGKIKKIPAIAMSIAIYGFGTMLTGLLPRSGFMYFVVISAFMGMSIPFYHGVRSAILQSSFPADILGRIMSLSMSIMRLAMPIGLVLAGTFAEVIGVDKWFLISGILAMVLAAFTGFSPALKGHYE
ncbi:MAG: MFS transporter [Clostridiales bacterium]|nr:MFS transporter [Clostridiales bacterium]